MKEKNYFCWFVQRVKNTRGATYAQHTRYLCAMLLAFILGIGQMWADTKTYSFASADELNNLTYTAGDASDSWAVCTSKTNNVSPRDGGFVQYKCGKSSKTATFVTKESFDNISDISFYIASSDKGKTQVKIEVSSKADFSSDVTEIVNATGGLSGLGISSPSKNTWYSVSKSVATKSGYVRFTMTASSSGKYWSFDDIVITYTPSSGGGGEDPVCPGTLTISSKNDKTAFTEGDAIELTAALSAGNGAITYQWYKGGKAEGNKLTGKTAAKLEIASCVEGDAGDYYCIASKDDCSDAVNATAFAITVAHNPCATHHWFVATADATANGVTNWESFTNTITGSNNQNNSVTIDGTTYTLTKRTGSTGGGDNIIGFTIPANKAGTLYGYMKSSGSAARVLSLKKGDDVVKTNTEITGSSWTLITIDAIAPGTYTLSPDQNVQVQMFVLKICDATFRTITLEYADGETTDGSLDALDGAPATKPTDPTWAHHRFDGWYNGETLYDWTANVTGDLTLTAHWTRLYTISFAAGEGGSGDAPAAIADKAAGETFTVPANTFTAPAGNVFDNWSDGVNTYDPEDTYTVGTANVVLTANWRVLSTLYAITEGTHANGSITISPASQEAGETVTLTATPDADYLFSAWEVVKTEDGTDAGVTVTNGEFTMPAFAVTVNATFVADTRKKVLYVTSTAETTVKENDKLYDALKDIYNVSIVGQASEADQTNYDLVVLHESIGGSSYNAAAVAAAKTGSTPVLNTKSYFYNDGRFGWGAPNAGQSVKGATQNSAYCNIASHPLFDGLTVTDGFFEITDDAAAKCMQPVGSFTSGKEGYTLATTPNAGEGNGCAIHELTPAQRGASAGKYLMISVSNDKLNALNANGQKLFQNAAAYLIGSSEWSPVLVPTTPEITGTTAYSAGETIELTASATGESAATTYTWYKGTTLEAAKEAGAIQAAKTIAENGNVYSKAECVAGDAGTYWCVISNGTDCEANASVEITVSDASYNASFVSAHGTAPVATSGVSYTLPELTESGYVHQGWTANIDVTVDEAVVTAGTTIANGKTAIFGADVTFTAVWKQIFAVTFNLNGQSGSIAPQDIIDGEKATKPADPVVIGQEFGGWYTSSACADGEEFDFNTAITEAKELFAKWTAFEGCAMLYPSTTATAALEAGDNVELVSGSFGGNIAVVGMKNSTSIAYDSKGLKMGGGSADIISVTLNSDMADGTKISVTLEAFTGGRPRGLDLLNATGGNVKGGTILGWLDDGSADLAGGETGTFTYVVEAEDGLEGKNVFRLRRHNSTYIKSIKVENCGDAIVYHNVTSAVDPAGKGTVTLGASSIREGSTTTAEYSAIDPLYEFVSWSVSGAGASVENATANPATITVGTEDAVVTLNLQLIPVKFTVNYFDGTTAMGTELVPVNENPTASEIKTAKRHYTFLGWSLTDGGDIVALNTITRTEATTVNLYAKYEPVACPTSGTIFSMESDEAKKPGETVKVAKNGGSLDLAEYATISGGNATIANEETSDKDAISEDGEFLLKAAKEVMKIELNCVLQEGDIIRIPDNSAKLVISTSNAKTGTYQAFADKNTHDFSVTAAWAGVDDIYILYDGTSLKFTQVEVYRPALLTVSFDMKGHGSAIADIENVLEGSKIVAPSPAPTDEDYAFVGWYKENTLENEWKFDVDVVEANTTLYAKWLDKSDATLKSLKYGSTDIVLEEGIYEYNIGLAAATVAVPALTAVPSNPNATASVTNAAAFDEDDKATSTVVVTPEKDGAATQTYTVNFSKLAALPQVNVTKSIIFDFSKEGSTSLTNLSDVVLANLPGINNDENFNSQALFGSFNKLEGTYFQGSKLSFTTEVAGLLTITFRGTNNHARHLQVCVGDGETVVADWNYNNSSTSQTKSVEVPAGKVTLKAFEGTTPNNARIYRIEFLEIIDSRTGYAARELGTACYEYDALIIGAKAYEVAGADAHGYMAFDEIESGEIEAGKPYLFEAEGGKIYFCKQVGASETPATEEITVKGMHGTFTGTTLNQGDNNYYYFSGRNIWKVNDFSVSIPIPENRCYVDYDELLANPVSASSPAPGRRRITLGLNGKDAEQVATGIGNVQGDEVQSTKVLINGQLFILRGEKMYDATGRLVK